MTVAVVIPVFNGGRYLAEAVASVRSQSVRPDEIVVVDDGSTDGTAAWLHAQNDLTIVTQENRGAGAARNRGVQRVTASILAFLDADDIWRPDYIAHQLAALDADTSVDAVFVLGQNFAEDGLRCDQRQGYIPSAMVIRREAFFRVGRFDETPGVPEFAAWFLAARDTGLRYIESPLVLVDRRVHAGNKGRMPGAQSQYLPVLKQRLDRRRAAAK
jgi:glycosyltransferase involved in cell wall biosynthesis